MIPGLKKSIIFILLLFIGGTAGYSTIEGWSLFDSFYMTIITLSTTGFKEFKPLSGIGRFFTIILIIFGISFLFYALGKINIALFEEQIFRKGKMQKEIDKLKNHYIICGYGRMGEKIASELFSRKKSFIIIEKDNDHVKNIKDRKFLVIQGDATEDDVLISAGINSAQGMVAVLSNDVANVFATLTARGLNSKLKIITRADEDSSRQKLIKAGADRVVLPYEIGGFRITQALLKPTVVDYMDELFSLTDLGLQIDEIKISEKSKLIGKTLADSGIRGKLNVIILSIYRKNGDLIYNPTSDSKINNGDTLVVIGEISELKTLEEICIP
jgi:voltage-gated potassium channel